ncbi:hypothetical protein BpHYR1_037739 [Brachionus plicatilis]|uniref:Uncharacterized protein n=1 Tax=Brachionus plicatilis TaxID=10195 RepID=A0A3M7SB20_BRAPC|nr:hypothetical protein BpHYR1_037739 [Brachionus plicatilis]
MVIKNLCFNFIVCYFANIFAAFVSNFSISYTSLLQLSHVNMSHESFFRNHYNVIRTYINNL